MEEIRNNTYKFMNPNLRFMKWELLAITIFSGIFYLLEEQLRMFIFKAWVVMFVLIILTYILKHFNDKFDKEG